MPSKYSYISNHKQHHQLNKTVSAFQRSNGLISNQTILIDFENIEVQRLFKLLSIHDVKYMLVGGLATVHYGFVRTTTDLNIWIQDETSNRSNLVKALDEMGVLNADRYLNTDLIPDWTNLKVGKTEFELSLMAYMSCFIESDFDEVYRRSIHTQINDTPVRIISVADLITEKSCLGRAIDLDDVRRLNSIHRPQVYNGIKVDILTEREFKATFQRLTEGIFTSSERAMFISILGSEQEAFFDSTSDFLNLLFDDVEKDIPGEAKTFSIQQASELNRFIRSNKNKQRCYVHCSAGTARSGSIGKFIVDQLDGDLLYFKKTNTGIEIKREILKVLELGS